MLPIKVLLMLAAFGLTLGGLGRVVTQTHAEDSRPTTSAPTPAVSSGPTADSNHGQSEKSEKPDVSATSTPVVDNKGKTGEAEPAEANDDHGNKPEVEDAAEDANEHKNQIDDQNRHERSQNLGNTSTEDTSHKEDHSRSNG